MGVNCFNCRGKNPPKECLASGMYHLHPNMDECDQYQTARDDLSNLTKENFKEIKLRTALAQYLTSEGKLERHLNKEERLKKALEILELGNSYPTLP